jgi:hypothetical protein
MANSSFTQEQGLRRPSIDYYAFRHLPYAQFQALQIIYALFYQLQSLPTCSEDIHLVRHKTQFWMMELVAAYQGTPHHPVTRDLQVVLQDVPLPQADWVKIVTAIEMEIDHLLFDNDQEFRSYADKLYGSLYRLIARVLTQEPLPEEALAALGVARARLAVGEEAVLAFDQALAELKQSNNPELKPLRILGRLYRRQAEQPMLNLGPLKILGLSLRERLYSRT